jgi:hypothetical protein
MPAAPGNVAAFRNFEKVPEVSTTQFGLDTAYRTEELPGLISRDL